MLKKIQQKKKEKNNKWNKKKQKLQERIITEQKQCKKKLEEIKSRDE